MGTEPLFDPDDGRCPVCGTVMLAGWHPCRAQCPRCGGPVDSSAPDDWYCRDVFCGWEDDHAPKQ
jgi:predicted amidophosphoribosyltransferase